MIELKDVLEVRDFRKLLVTTSSLGVALTRAEIEAVLTENGVTLPLPYSISFVIKDSADKFYEVIYGKALDTFVYTRQDIAT